MARTVWTCPRMVATRVIDGDSWIADLDLGWLVSRIKVPFRLHAVDAAGGGEPVRKEQATLLVRSLLLSPTGPVVCSIVSQGFDKYGRTLADVTLPDGSDLGQALVTSGLGVPWDGTGAHPPGGGA